MFEATVQRVIDRVDQLRHEVNDAWQIPRDEALLLAQIVRLGCCRSLCEIGVSYGFSTLHLAAATRSAGGRLNGFDISPKKIEAAGRHLAEAGLDQHATLHLGDARETVAGFTPPEAYDFAFIDATKSESFGYLEALWPKLAERVVIVTDNTGTHADELRPFVEHLRAQRGCRSCHVPVGNGIELTIRG